MTSLSVNIFLEPKSFKKKKQTQTLLLIFTATMPNLLFVYLLTIIFKFNEKYTSKTIISPVTEGRCLIIIHIKEAIR